jgi:hypothetical protein
MRFEQEQEQQQQHKSNNNSRRESNNSLNEQSEEAPRGVSKLSSPSFQRALGLEPPRTLPYKATTVPTLQHAEI